MLHQYPIVAFIATSNAERARRFYGETLGLPLLHDQLPFALVYDAHGTMLRITPVGDMLRVAGYTVLGWQVPDAPTAARQLTARGVEFQRFPGMEQDEDGVWSAPGGAKVAWFKDPDGNLLSISS
jgi:catechol 2,3-dioxygenase-like lactoylglutathione lyase family enzyme